MGLGKDSTVSLTTENVSALTEGGENMYHWGDTDDDIYGYSPYDGIICRESDEEIVDCPCCGLGPLIYYSLDICRCRNCGENIRVDDLTE